MKRGIVTPPGVFERKAGGFTLKRIISRLEINYFCLYWDKLVIPENGQMRFIPHITDELESCGMLSRFIFSPRVFSSDTYISELVNAQFYALDLLRSKESDTDWRIHQIGNDVIYRESEYIELVQRELIRIELLGVLPVPDGSVHLHDILEFKLRRNAELVALHYYCDELYLEILNSADPNLLRARNFSKLKKAVEDLDKINNEVWQSPVRFNLDISSEFDVSNIRAGFAALLGASQSPMPLTTAIIGGVLSVAEGFVKLKVELRGVRKSNSVNHIVYLSNARKEGII
ncbi:DUF6236 family protein [Klebsiella pneumoniae]|mgnify:CR=1 FL=1|uniref:DUF6236 family protein n=1 Tax=Klebsiella/Raoultella group TaxID=2890311 RepID=UPI0010AEADA0|nr:DUF6236 family protein [Raoultella planticola]EIW9040918.1 hypothetical protein [Klebsiella pneumoniae]DAL48134.1 MAG TPA_asm: hypothetical protein [Caudoviricetes sp.]HDT6597776.1 hypothetical protein [Raoultella ornithinolytica]EKW9012070.1 hypothetical protein [Klebsiella pneumoniae]EKZ6077548.1 hypothetical protein [Klebsiella pneumoniae]